MVRIAVDGTVYAAAGSQMRPPPCASSDAPRSSLPDAEHRQEASEPQGPPEIMNTDQGSQFTGSAWITTLTEAGVRISMDGRGRYLYNIFIERLWRSLKQEAIYLEEIIDGFQARKVVKDWMAFYNTNRPHSALDRRTPDEAYWDGREEQKAA